MIFFQSLYALSHCINFWCFIPLVSSSIKLFPVKLAVPDEKKNICSKFDDMYQLIFQAMEIASAYFLECFISLLQPGINNYFSPGVMH